MRQRFHAESCRINCLTTRMGSTEKDPRHAKTTRCGQETSRLPGLMHSRTDIEIGRMCRLYSLKLAHSFSSISSIQLGPNPLNGGRHSKRLVRTVSGSARNWITVSDNPA